MIIIHYLPEDYDKTLSWINENFTNYPIILFERDSPYCIDHNN